MKSLKTTKTLIAAGLLLVGSLAAHAQTNLFITEVSPSGSGNSTYAADWFELTNTGTTAVNISGWKMDDNSHAFASAVSLTGITSIAAGQSVIFIEDTNAPSTDAALATAFKSAWFGSSIPAGLTVGFYGGSSVGLSTSGDAVNIYNGSGTLITAVAFGNATTGVSFTNPSLISDTNTLLTTLSVAGVKGAFVSNTGSETGSPGIAAIPEPSTYALIAGAAVMGFVALRRKARRNVKL